MAGTNKQLKTAESLAIAPAIILVQPQLGENIGMCARAMLNCGVTELRIVNPRDGWPNEDAVAAASGAVSVLENAKLFATTKEAVADLEFVLATTARSRDMVKEIYTTAEAAQKVRAANASAQKCGILFGPERAGLDNDDVALADAILNIPLNPGFSSLNLAQAVLLVSHAWFSCHPEAKPKDLLLDEAGEILRCAQNDKNGEPATKGDIENLLKHLEDELEKGGFFRSPEQRPTLLRNIRNYFFRSGMTLQETRTMHGIFACLIGKRSWK